MLDSSATAQRAKSFSKNRVTGSQFIKSCERRKLCQSAPRAASLVFHVSNHIRKNAGRCRIVTSLGGNYNTASHYQFTLRRRRTPIIRPIPANAVSIDDPP